MSVMMEIAFTHSIKRIPFDSVKEAQKVLDELAPLIGLDPYRLNDKSKGSFIIKSSIGNSVIHIGAVTSVSIVDYSKYTEEQAVKDFAKYEYNHSERYLKYMIDAGLEKYIKI